MSLEIELEELKARVAALGERVRLDAVAERFLAGVHEIRVGDFFRLDCGDKPSRLDSVASDGKWTHAGHNGRYSEPFRIPNPGDHERLYTIAEVAEIVAKATRTVTGSVYTSR